MGWPPEQQETEWRRLDLSGVGLRDDGIEGALEKKQAECDGWRRRGMQPSARSRSQMCSSASTIVGLWNVYGGIVVGAAIHLGAFRSRFARA